MLDELNAPQKNAFDEWLRELIGGEQSTKRTFNALARTIYGIASKGHSVIIGRGSSLLTRGLPGGVHVRLIGSIEFRLEYLKRNPARAHEATPQKPYKN